MVSKTSEHHRRPCASSYVEHSTLMILLFVDGPLCLSSGLIMSLEKELASLIEELRQVVEVT